jgi:hypothetical protein
MAAAHGTRCDLRVLARGAVGLVTPDPNPGDHDDAGVCWLATARSRVLRTAAVGTRRGLVPGMVQAWFQVSGLVRVRSSSRVMGCKNIRPGSASHYPGCSARRSVSAVQRPRVDGDDADPETGRPAKVVGGRAVGTNAAGPAVD